METAVIATLDAQKETGVSNAIFEWVNFLFENKSKIESYHLMLGRLKTLKEEINSLKPKNAYLDDTAYQRKLKEGNDYLTNHWLPIKKTYHDKFIELGFTDERPTQIRTLRKILDTWNNKVTDKAEVRKQLAECKKKYNHLQTDKVKLFFDYYDSYNNGFFSTLDEILTEMFDTVLGNKYQALADDLKPYLEQHYPESNCQVLESIIDRKQLPNWVKYKPIWTKQAHAIAFLDYMGWKPNEVKGLFDYRDGKGKVIETTTVTKRSKKPNSELLAIFKKHIHK